MFIESRDAFVRLNVAQEVMRVAVDSQTQFAEEAERSAERARAEETERVREEAASDDQAHDDGLNEREPQNVEGSLGISIDIEV